ncbi:Conserved hypothetical protein [Geotrichum candidum]|uniref:SWI5-dependent HO expression protein 3 n=1 Tax=Geotrichum candidum TaxID=1173061 RepID=A0A0J9X7L4_GEOCN|nr:Conserved hypothetical protein [Geotrichum candidum]
MTAPSLDDISAATTAAAAAPEPATEVPLVESEEAIANENIKDEERLSILKSEIARKTSSLKHLEQLAQELPSLSPSSRPLSMSSTMSSVPSSPLMPVGTNGSAAPATTTPVTTTEEKGAVAASPQAPLAEAIIASSTSPQSNYSVSSPSSISSFPRGSVSSSVSAYEANIARSNWATTSHVIEHLQQTIDALRRDLNQQTARAVEEKQGRDAIRKRCDNIESQLEGLRHQNETLNSIISRKERRVKELEKELETKAKHVDSLENDQRQYIESKNEYEGVLKQVKEDQERSDASYKAVVEGAKSVRLSFETKFKDISEQIAKLVEERNSDKDQIAKLEKVIAEQKAERAKIEQLRVEMAKKREEHAKEITALFEKFKVTITVNEQETEDKINATLRTVDELKRTHSLLTTQIEGNGK